MINWDEWNGTLAGYWHLLEKEREMSESHTPGPWRVDEGGLIRGPYGYSIAKLHITLEDNGSQMEANARLIAAAPDYRKALETIRDGFWSEGETAEEQVADLKRIAAEVLGGE